MKIFVKLTVFGLLLSAFSFSLSAQTMNENFRKTQPEPLKPIAFNVPKPFETELKNGLKIVIIEDKSLPLVNYRLAFQQGDINDPADSIGINSAVADLLNEGTKTRTSKQIAEEIERLGASISTSSSSDNTVISASTLSLYSSDVLKLIADMVLNPVFPENEVNLYKSNAIDNLKFERSDAGFLADEQINKIIYGDHPYSITSPTAENIKSLNRVKLIEYQKNNFTPNRVILIAVGNVDRKEFLKNVEDLFGKWESKPISKVKFATPPERKEKTITIVDRPGSVQSNIVLSNLAIDYSSPDYFPVLVMNQVLGGGASARLFLNLREDKSYTYGAYSRFNTKRLAGDFEATSEVRTPVTGDALKEFFYELDRIRKDDVDNSELQDAKNYLTGTFPIRAETQGGLTNLILTQQLYGLPVDYLQTYRDRINAVTPADVKRVANKYLQPEKVAMVIVGDADEILPQVKPYAEKINIVDTEGTSQKLDNYGKASGVETANIAGKWNLTIEIPGQELPLTVTFKQDGENVSGELSSALGGGEISGGKIKGNKINAVAKTNVQGQDIELTINGTVDGDSIKGTISIPISPQPLPFSGSRAN